MRLAAVLLAAGALVAAPLHAHGDPTEIDPDLAAADQDYAAARKAIVAEQWGEAIARLRTAEVRHPDHADLQNYLGYAHRNLKQFDAAFRHYKRAIELEPRHRGAHEYIGEAYLETKQLAKAEEHMKVLEILCAICAERRDLDRAIKDYKRRNNIS